MLSLKDLKRLDRDDLLELVGLQRSSSNDWVAPALTARTAKRYDPGARFA